MIYKYYFFVLQHIGLKVREGQIGDNLKKMSETTPQV